MKRLLFFLFIIVICSSFMPGDGWRSFIRENKNSYYWGGNWGLTGTKNQWGNGMSWSSKSPSQLAAFTNASDTLLSQWDRDDSTLTIRASVFGPWRKLVTNATLTGYVPYIGATSAVNLGTFSLTTTGTVTAGTLSSSGTITAVGQGTFGGVITTILGTVSDSIPLVLAGNGGSGKKELVLPTNVGSGVPNYSYASAIMRLPNLIVHNTISAASFSGTYSSLSATSPIFFNPITGVISTQLADATHQGVVNTAAQVFGGQKTFNDGIVLANSSYIVANPIAFRVNNNADNATNLEVLDNGNLTARGSITGTTLAGTIVTAAQPNITSVGTLTNLSVSNNISNGGTITTSSIRTAASGTYYNDYGYSSVSMTMPSSETSDNMNFVINGGSAATTGNAFVWKTQTGNTTPANAMVLDKTAALTVTGSVTAPSFIGTIATAAQPNITSVGTLTSLTVSGESKLSGGLILGYVGVNSTYSALISDIIINCTSGTFTVTVPDGTSVPSGKTYVIKNNGVGTITVAAASGTVNGSSVNLAAGVAVNVSSTGSSNWIIW